MKIVDQFTLGEIIEIDTYNGYSYMGEILSKGSSNQNAMWEGWVEINEDNNGIWHSAFINVNHIVAYRTKGDLND